MKTECRVRRLVRLRLQFLARIPRVAQQRCRHTRRRPTAWRCPPGVSTSSADGKVPWRRWWFRDMSESRTSIGKWLSALTLPARLVVSAVPWCHHRIGSSSPSRPAAHGIPVTTANGKIPGVGLLLLDELFGPMHSAFTTVASMKETIRPLYSSLIMGLGVCGVPDTSHRSFLGPVRRAL